MGQAQAVVSRRQGELEGAIPARALDAVAHNRDRHPHGRGGPVLRGEGDAPEGARCARGDAGGADECGQRRDHEKPDAWWPGSGRGDHCWHIHPWPSQAAMERRSEMALRYKLALVTCLSQRSALRNRPTRK